MRFAAITLLFVASLPARENVADWIAALGGSVVKDSAGDLIEVSLRGAFVGDSDLERLRDLRKLRRLDLSLTRITDVALEHLKDLPSLTELDLTYAESVGDGGVARLRSAKKLERIYLEGTKVSDSGAVSLAAILTLRVINLRCAQITDAALERLEPLTQLEELVVGGNRITGHGLVYLQALPSLKLLDLSGAQTTDNGISSVTLTDRNIEGLAGLAGLESLNLASVEIPRAGEIGGNGIQEVISLRVSDAGLEKLMSLRALRNLTLTRAPITGKGIGFLAQLPRLQNLVLSHAENIGDEEMDALSKLARLTSLDLSGTKVSDAGLRKLAKQKSLRMLYVSGSRVTANGVAELLHTLPACKVVRSE
ncbi:MAG: hypothetical protein HYZ37_09475 [Candidatus Solibacter usitatus]|nr:hypothetical protein [Candidatus Solibacter usitatus]